jgi:opacity protein-like surface antigen
MIGKSLRPVRILLLLAAPLTSPALAQSPVPQSHGQAAAREELFVEPKNGQSREQQWDDRYACDAWSKNQSGVDSAQRAAGASEDPSRRDQYRRAMTACLEARGYSARFGVPQPPSSQPPAAPPTASPLPPLPPPPPPRSVAPPPPPPPPFYIVHSYPQIPEFTYHPFAVQIEGGQTITQGNAAMSLDDGWSGGLGLTWFPSSALPLGLRVDGSYSRFAENSQSLNAAAQSAGTNVSFGHEDLYGGDLDAELDLKMGPHVREYFYGGIGRYREHTVFKQASFQSGFACYYGCFLAEFGNVSTVSESTSGWLNSWNAGIGFEFALANRTSFFIDARYLHLSTPSKLAEFVPIRLGLRF